MANPSIQIGNSNWAIKEDDLLGYSTVGTNYLPKPMTMTRASLGTRVNPEGLVEDVALLGSENIDLTTGSAIKPTDWGSATTSGISYLATTGTISYYDTGFSVTSGITYKLSFTLSDYTGSSNLGFSGTGGVSNNAKLEADGSYSEYFIASSTAELRLFGRSTNTGVFSNVSVKEATIDNLPRVDYTDGTSSLLVEPMRTNLVTYSEDLTQWTGLIALSIGLNQGTSPSGLTDANLLSIGIDASATRHRLYNLFSFVSGDTYTFSMFAKKNEQDWFQLMFSSTAFDAQSYANFDLNNGVVGNTGTSTTANIIDYGSGWYRCSITCTATASITTTYEVLTTNNTDSGRYPSYQSNSNVDVCYLWGSQLEEGSYATSYIPTDGGTVTRVKDQYEKTGISNLINSTEGVLFAEIAALDNDGTFRMIAISDGTIDNVVNFYYRTDINKITIRLKSGSTQEIFENFDITATNFNKVAFRYKSGESNLFINGVKQKVSDYTSTNMPIGLSQLSLDSGGNTNFFYGKVKQLQVFKTALSDSELVTLTT